MTASSETTASVTLSAAAAEEIATAISEIRLQAINGSEKAQLAASDATQMKEHVRSLSQVVQQVGSVANTIAGIASQTNLLALSATIETARAGEFGRSFSVVASEVKAPANQASNATEEIARQISEVQAATGETRRRN